MIDTNSSRIDIYGATYKNIPLLELKEWIGTQIRNGKKSIRVECYTDRDNEVDEIELIAETI